MIVGLSNAEPLTQADSENTVKEYLNDHEDSLGTIYFFDSQDSQGQDVLQALGGDIGTDAGSNLDQLS